MVEFVNGKPTGTPAKFRLCIEGSVIKILGNTFFERDYGSDGDRVIGEAGPFCIRVALCPSTDVPADAPCRADAPGRRGRPSAGCNAPENFSELGRGLRRRSLVTNSLRAAIFKSRRAPGPGPQRVELEFGVQNRISRPRPRWSHTHPSSTAGPRRFSVGLSGKSQFWGFLPQNEPFRHHCLPRPSEAPIHA
jgi:hypothetical protein